MQCSKLDISVDIDRLLSDLDFYIKIVTDIAAQWPDDVTRVMCNYPAGSSHYTSRKRKDEEWEIVDTDVYTLYTRYTKFGTRMVSAYLKEEHTISPYVTQLVNEIGVDGKAQIAIAYAEPKFRLEKHVDSMGLTRHHFPLITNDSSYFEIFGSNERIYPKTGEVWKLDTSKEHAANNDSETQGRIHMIVDFLDG